MIYEFDCEVCSKHVRIYRSPAGVKNGGPRFCSQRCNGAARKGTGPGLTPNYEFDCAACGKRCRVYRSPSATRPRCCSLGCIGQSQRGAANPSYTGGRVRHSHGYILVLAPDHPDADPRGYVYEHRLVIERLIGRRLRAGEVVHHRNRVRDDNRIENLLFLPSHSAHMKLHRMEAARA